MLHETIRNDDFQRCNIVKGAMSPNTHARANENKLEIKKTAQLFQVVSEILEGCFYLSKSQPSFDS